MRLLDDAEHGGKDASEVRAQLHERPPRIAEAVGDRDLGVTEALRDQIEGEDLRVVVVVRDVARCAPRRG